MDNLLLPTDFLSLEAMHRPNFTALSLIPLLPRSSCLDLYFPRCQRDPYTRSIAKNTFSFISKFKNTNIVTAIGVKTLLTCETSNLFNFPSGEFLLQLSLSCPCNVKLPPLPLPPRTPPKNWLLSLYQSFVGSIMTP